jgi:hypothetical protein
MGEATAKVFIGPARRLHHAVERQPLHHHNPAHVVLLAARRTAFAGIDSHNPINPTNLTNLTNPTNLINLTDPTNLINPINSI